MISHVPGKKNDGENIPPCDKALAEVAKPYLTSGMVQWGKSLYAYRGLSGQQSMEDTIARATHNTGAPALELGPRASMYPNTVEEIQVNMALGGLQDGSMR